MKRFYAILIIFFASNCGWAWAQAPHNVVGRLTLENGSRPGAVTFTAHIVGREGDVLNQNSVGCGYSVNDGIWWVQTRNFTNGWTVGEVIHVAFSDGTGATGSIETPLTTDPQDDAGSTVLSNPAHAAKLSVGDLSVARGSNFNLPVSMTGLGVADSVIAYELRLTFDTDVLLPLGGDATGTMTANWGAVYSTPGDGELKIGGFTTNQTSTRLVDDGGVLVNLHFQAQGLPGSQTSATSLVRLESAVIYTLDETIMVSHSKTGAVTVNEAGVSITRDIALYPYWNLISLALVPSPHTVPEVFNGLDIDYVFTYSATEGPRSWDIRRPDDLNTLKSLDGLSAYWVKTANNTPLNWHLTGTSIDVDTPIHLYTGWNLLGYLPTESDNITHALTSLGSDYVYMMTFDALSKTSLSWDVNRPSDLNYLKNLSPQSGYWIRMAAANVLTYPVNGYVAAKHIPVRLETVVSQDSIIVTPHWCEFWGVQEDVLAAGDTLRAYDSDGVLCGKTTVISGGGFLIYVYGDDAITTMYDEGANEGDTLSFTVNSVPFEVSVGSPIWNERASKEIQLQPVQTSSVDSGSQGASKQSGLRGYTYPNPFTVKTMIGFDLWQRQSVTLCVFNMMGQKVAQLLTAEPMMPGHHELQWNGFNMKNEHVRSGVYFYQIEAGGERHSGKMLKIQ